MTDDKSSQPPVDLGDFGRRLRRAQGEREQTAGAASGVNSRGLGMAFRMATELVAALIVGGAIGWFLDRWLDTRPWLFLVFLALGMAAGMLNAFREAKRLEREG
jgi:ATP synthase protein I